MNVSANSSIGAALKKTATNLRVFLDAFVGEDRGKAHLISVVGGDVEIGALAAAFANGDSFTVVDLYGAESIVSLGEKPLSFRGSIVVPDANGRCAIW